MNYLEAREFIDYTNSLGIKPGLDTVKELLSRVGNPQNKLNVIHVAGTNGKGSICAYLEYGLRECGLSVGRYISPTLFTYLERFQINGDFISEDTFCKITGEVKKVCSEMVADGLDHPTSFEVETAIAFLWFLDSKADIVILETGMGGKEDATNVVDKPLATVFATISFDHMKFLGDTIDKIAANKAGIMRENVPVIASFMPDIIRNGIKYNASKTIKEEADKINAPVFFADNGESIDFENPLRGEFQKINVSAALMTYNVVEEVIKEKFPDKRINKDCFISGLSKTKWPGRYETICEKPLIIRDGAHNADAALKLFETIKKDERITGKVHLIMGCFKDKEYEKVLKIMLPLAKTFTAITAPNPERALDKKDLERVAIVISEEMGINLDTNCADKMGSALEHINCSQDDTVIIFGSLSLSALCENIMKRG